MARHGQSLAGNTGIKNACGSRLAQTPMMIDSTTLAAPEKHLNLRELVEEITQGNQTLKILNVGCGHAALSEKMYDDGYHDIVNIDSSELAVSQMQRRNENRSSMTWRTMDAKDMDFENDQFDLVIERGILDDISSESDAFLAVPSYLKEVARVLRPGGIYLCASFEDPSDGQDRLEQQFLEWNSMDVKDVGQEHVHICQVSEFEGKSEQLLEEWREFQEEVEEWIVDDDYFDSETMGQFDYIYGTGPEYWDNLYANVPDTNEWFSNYSMLQDLIEGATQGSRSWRILHAGCGNSPLSKDMYDDGYHNIVNIDNSQVVIEQMRQENLKRSGMTWSVMDATSMAFEDDSFDLVLDKGLLDVFSTIKDFEVFIARYLKEVVRVLRPGGIFFLVTFGDAEDRLRFLEGANLEVVVKAKKVDVDYVYICQALGSDKSNKPLE